MALLQEWQKIAYNEQADRAKLQKFWQDYFLVEKGIYEKLLDHRFSILRNMLDQRIVIQFSRTDLIRCHSEFL